MHNYGVYASRWPLTYETVWTIVNRTPYNITGQQMTVTDWPGTRYFDLYHGVELKPEIPSSTALPRVGSDAHGFGPGKQTAVLSFDMEAHGYGAILAVPGEPNAAIKALMQRMASLTAKPLAAFSHEPAVLPQSLVAIAPTKPATETPANMVRIPGGDFHFVVRGVEIEGGASNLVDV
jgi:hypothetical protein